MYLSYQIIIPALGTFDETKELNNESANVNHNHIYLDRKNSGNFEFQTYIQVANFF